MRCFLRLPTYVVSLLLISLTFGGVLDEGEIKRIALREVQKRFGESVRVKAIDVFLKTPIRYTELNKVSLSVREGYPRGTLHLYIKTLRGVKRISATLYLLWRCRVLTANRDIETGERIYPWEVSFKEVFMERCPKQWIEDPQELINYITLKPLKKDQPVRKSYLKREPLVRRGEEVRVLLREGNIEIELRGKAVDTGFYGSAVRVETSKEKVIRGRVVGEGVVLVR